MQNKLFVAGIPFSLTDQELSDAFAAVGTVTSAKVITDRESGRSRGFGFVEMSTDEEAENAINQLNGTKIGGREVTVNVARPREDRR